jgi:hypothetical protein
LTRRGDHNPSRPTITTADRQRVLETLRRLYPETVSNGELTNRLGLSKSQVWTILTGLIAAGAVRRIGKGRGTLYVAIEGLPASRRLGIRPRRLGFGDEWRRRALGNQSLEARRAEASIGEEPEVHAAPEDLPVAATGGV